MPTERKITSTDMLNSFRHGRGKSIMATIIHCTICSIIIRFRRSKKKILSRVSEIFSHHACKKHLKVVRSTVRRFGFSLLIDRFAVADRAQVAVSALSRAAERGRPRQLPLCGMRTCHGAPVIANVRTTASDRGFFPPPLYDTSVRQKNFWMLCDFGLDMSVVCECLWRY